MLLDHPVLQGDLAEQSRRQAVADAAFHLGGDLVGGDGHAAVHRADHPAHPRLAIDHGDLGHLGHHRAETFVHRDCPGPAWLGRLAPIRLGQRQLQDAQVPVGLGAPVELAAVFGRVDLRPRRQLVDGVLHGHGRVGRTHRAPEGHRDNARR